MAEGGSVDKKLKSKKNSIRVLHWLSRDIHNILFWIVVLFNSLLLFWSSGIVGYFECDPIDRVSHAYHSGVAADIVPIAVSVVSVMRFYDELSVGIYRVEVIRTGRLKFVFQKIMEAFVSGALVMFATLVVYTLAVYVYAGVHQMPVIMEGVETLGSEGTTVYLQWAREGKGILVYLIQCSFMMIYGTVWAVLGTSFTVFITNKRVAVLFPYILKVLMECLGAYCYVKWGTGILFLWNLMMSPWSTAKPLRGVVYEFGCLGVVLLLSMTIIYAGMERIYSKQG